MKTVVHYRCKGSFNLFVQDRDEYASQLSKRLLIDH